MYQEEPIFVVIIPDENQRHLRRVNKIDKAMSNFLKVLMLFIGLIGGPLAIYASIQLNEHNESNNTNTHFYT